MEAEVTSGSRMALIGAAVVALIVVGFQHASAAEKPSVRGGGVIWGDVSPDPTFAFSAAPPESETSTPPPLSSHTLASTSAASTSNSTLSC